MLVNMSNPEVLEEMTDIEVKILGVENKMELFSVESLTWFDIELEFAPKYLAKIKDMMQLK